MSWYKAKNILGIIEEHSKNNKDNIRIINSLNNGAALDDWNWIINACIVSTGYTEPLIKDFCLLFK